MDKKMLSTLALLAGGFGAFIGIWGLVEGTDGNDVASVEESFTWVAIGLLALGISAICSALAARR